jgi:hypothetical protein
MVESLYRCERCGASTNAEPLRRLDLVLVLCKRCSEGFKNIEQGCLDVIFKKMLTGNNSVAGSSRIVKYNAASKDLLH